MKKWAGVFIGLLLFPFAMFAQEIPNQIDAVQSADPGDYILLPSGNKYVLTEEEIMIANGSFSYESLNNVATKTRADGTVIKTVSQAHEIQIYPGGEIVHVIKTKAAFAYTLKYIEDNYHPMRYLDEAVVLRDSKPITAPDFRVFRVFIQSEAIISEYGPLEIVAIIAYNYEGQNFVTKYCSTPDMVWGLVSPTKWRPQ